MATERFENPIVRQLRKLALCYPEVAEGDSGVKRSFKARKKGFLYLGENAKGYSIMVKLGPSASPCQSVARQ